MNLRQSTGLSRSIATWSEFPLIRNLQQHDRAKLGFVARVYNPEEDRRSLRNSAEENSDRKDGSNCEITYGAWEKIFCAMAPPTCRLSRDGLHRASVQRDRRLRPYQKYSACDSLPSAR